MLTPPQLQAICEVVAAGSFRSAAQRLGYTPSAVSQQISTIERALGVALFERSPRSVRPTPAGLQLARRAGRLLADLSATEDEMRAYAAAERGRLRLGSFWSAGFRLVPTVLTGFLRDRPEVDVRYEEGDPQVTVPAVVEGRLDLAVIFEYGVVPHSWPDGLDHTLVREEPLYVLLPAGHPLAGRRHIRLADLRDERWISYHEDTDAARCLRHICAAGGFLPEVLFRTNDYNLPYELVRPGPGGGDRTRTRHHGHLRLTRRLRPPTSSGSPIPPTPAGSTPPAAPGTPIRSSPRPSNSCTPPPRPFPLGRGWRRWCEGNRKGGPGQADRGRDVAAGEVAQAVMSRPVKRAQAAEVNRAV